MKRMISFLALALMLTTCTSRGFGASNPPQKAEVVLVISDLSDPINVAVDAQGNIYVVETGAYRVHKFDRDGKSLTMWGARGQGDGEFDFGSGRVPVSGVAVGPDGSVYVIDSYNDRVQKFDGNGQFIARWGGSGTGDGQFTAPFDLVSDQQGNVYVSDAQDKITLQKFDSAGQFLTAWSGLGTEDGRRDEPNGLGIDEQGHIYVAEAGYTRVQVLDGEGHSRLKLEAQGQDDGAFVLPVDVAVDREGNIFVVDSRRRDIQMFDANGAFIFKWDGSDLENADVFRPYGLAVDAEGKIYVADYSGKRVVVFRLR